MPAPTGSKVIGAWPEESTSMVLLRYQPQAGAAVSSTSLDPCTLCCTWPRPLRRSTTIRCRSRHSRSAAWARCNSYGPRMRPDDGRAIPTFIRQALRGEPITVAGDGAQTRSVCFVGDTVRGILALAFSAEAGPMNIGSPDELSVFELADRIRRLTGSRSAIEFVDLPVDDPKVRRSDTTLARERLGWRPTVSLDEGLRRTIDWFVGELAERAFAEAR
jgi:dTDP-D-glucose 4,6-dehydratase